MKNAALILAALVLTFSLSACATNSGTGSAKVKCPACGYEFAPDAGKDGGAQ